MSKRNVEDEVEKVKSIFRQEEPTPAKSPDKPTRKRKVVAEELPEIEDKPKYLKTKQAAKGILHCEIGPDLYERAALFAYDLRAPVKDMTDLTKKALIEYLDRQEPLLKKLKAYQEKLTTNED